MNLQELKELQLKIIKKNKKLNILFSILFSIIMMGIILIILLSRVKIQIVIMPVLVVSIFLIVIFNIIKISINGKDIALFDKNFKNIFVLNALKNNFENLVYKPEDGFSQSFIDDIGMLNTADRYCSNDFISGIYKNIKFQQSDIHIEEKHTETDSEGNSRTEWETLFRGRLMIFDFNKKFKANLQVSNYSFDAESLPWGKKFSRVTMEDVEFNKQFCVYAQNEHEAFYILTPHFMEKLKQISKEIKCGIMFCFVDNKLHIAIDNNEDSFEYNVFKIIDEQEVEKELMKDTKVIMNFVDELNLDNELFGKGV